MAAFPKPGDRQDVELGKSFTPKFDADGLIPCITTDAQTGEVLMFAWMNAEALTETISTGQACYWSRSRGQLWRKGETSGSIQSVIEIMTDCDQDVMLLKVIVAGSSASCHQGYRSCFYRRLEKNKDGTQRLEFVGEQLANPDDLYSD